MAEDSYNSMLDRWPVNHDPIDNPRLAFAVTASDTLDLPNSSGTPSYAKALYIGTTGNVKVTMAGDKGNPSTPVTFNGVVAGTILNVQVRRVWTSSPSNILALMD